MNTLLSTTDADISSRQYAGFWIRTAAYLIDIIITLIIALITMFVFFGTPFITQDELNALGTEQPLLIIGYYITSIAVSILYFPAMESSAKQGSIGKIILDLKIMKEDGSRLTFLNALGRYFAKVLSALIFLIGFMMVGWTKKKQGLHDFMANSFVVYSPTDQTE